MADTAVRVGRLSALLNPLTYTIMNIGIVAVLWFGGRAGLQGRPVPGGNHRLCQLHDSDPAGSGGGRQPGGHLYQGVGFRGPGQRSAGDRILRLLRKLETPVLAQKRTHPKIAFQDVGVFLCKGRKRRSLQGITVDIKRGETVGIIGGTGSGKSTLVQPDSPVLRGITGGSCLLTALT